MSFYRQWVVANSWSEGIGLGLTLVLGFVVGARIEVAGDPLTLVVAAVLAVLLGTLLEGVLIGFAQGRILHRHAPSITVRRWTMATAIGAGAAWLLGMVPSTLLGILQTDVGGAVINEPPAAIQYALALALGIVLGPVLAFPQMLALKRITPRAGIWLPANAAAWGAGMPLIFFGMDRLPWGGATAGLVLGIGMICTVVGAVVGAIHGVFLRRMLSPVAQQSVIPPVARRAGEVG